MFPAATAWLFALAHLRVRVSELLPGFLESSEPNVTGCVPQRAWPTMARLARTRLLNVSRMHADDRRVCPGDRPSILDVADAPGSLCVYRADVPDGFDWLFDMYRHERVMLGRWLERVRTCGPWAAPAAPGAAPRLAAPCEADVVVVASPQLHHHAQHGSTWRWTKCLGSAALARFWREIRAAYFDGWQRPPVVVVNEPYAFDVRANVHLLRELASQPAAFTSRVVVTTSMSSQTLAVRAHFPRSWMDGGEVELRRRECLAARKGPAAARAGGPLLVTLPRTTGVSRAPDWAAPAPGPDPWVFARGSERDIAVLYSGTLGHRGQFDNKGMQYARGLMRRGLEAAGAACSKRTGCHICVRGRPCARATLRAQVFKDAARARLCLQPPGDVLGRSHFYAAALAGCVPVLIEGGHRAYDDNGTTWWAWRRPGPGDGPAACAGTAPAREWPGLVDYGAFAVFVRAREMEDPRWALPLVGLAADEARLARMRAALSRVLPRFVYGRGLADGPEQPRDDAFALFEDLLERAARVMRPESRRAVARA